MNKGNIIFVVGSSLPDQGSWEQAGIGRPLSPGSIREAEPTRRYVCSRDSSLCTGGQVTLCLEGCSPMSEAGTCLKGESKNTHEFGSVTDRNLCWFLSLILAVWGPVEPGGPSLESKTLKEDAGNDPPPAWGSSRGATANMCELPHGCCPLLPS